MKRKTVWALAIVVAMVLVVAAVAFASSIDVAVVDVTAPTGSVALATGGSGAIIINMNVTGNQVGTATFKVYRDWTLSGGVFTGSNPQTFTVSPRTSQDPATLFSTTGTVTVVAGQASGPFPLAVSAYDITNSNDTGAKLSDGADSNYQVIVAAPSDITPPVITVPANITAEATGPGGAVVTFTASADDAVDGDVPVTCVPASGSTFPIGTTTVNATATDAHHNVAHASFTVTVRDTTAPAITVPDDIVAEATSAAGAVVTWTAPSAADAVGPSPTVSASPASGSTFAIGVHTVTVTAKDAAGNIGTATFKVTVVYHWGGILPPINPDGSSIFKLGSTVPVKFRLTYAGGGVVSTVVAKLSLSKLTDAIWGDEAEAISTAAATTGNLFRYDASGNLYIFNLATKGLTAGTYRLTIVLDDGTSHTVEISLKK